MPQVSVIIPTHNRATLLARAIQSVLSQEFADFELWIVDDASTDDTPEVVEQLEDARIRYLRLPENRGVSAARNTAMRSSSAPLIVFLDDDDEYLPGFLAKTVEAHTDAPDSVGFGWTGVRLVGLDGSTEDRIWQPEYASRRHAYLEMIGFREVGSGCGFVVHRKCLAKVGYFDETMRRTQDADYIIRLAKEYDFIVIPEVLVRVYRHPPPRFFDVHVADAYASIIEKHLDALEEIPKSWAAVHHKAARLHLNSGRPGDARRFSQAALSKRPLHLNSLAMLALTALPGRWGRAINLTTDRVIRRIRRLSEKFRC
jgi:glycosyltransferase involved in cell wall biosynthesis